MSATGRHPSILPPRLALSRLILHEPHGRAIHIEVLESLETDAFINGFRRICSRRGQPKTVRSDRGTNLVGACFELAREMKRLDKDKVIGTARRMGVEWSFNPPMASHHGGVWERMIRTIPKVLMAVIPSASMTDDVLQTTFCEVENIVNGRPLTKCSADVCDEYPLTPNHYCQVIILQCGSSFQVQKFVGSAGNVFRTFRLRFGNDGSGSTFHNFSKGRHGPRRLPI